MVNIKSAFPRFFIILPIRQETETAMTRLYTEKLPVRCVDLGAESTLPLLGDVTPGQTPRRSDLPESDGLFLNYRFVKSAFPYRAQDNYTRTFVRDTLDAVVLENELLRAAFVPTMGGKLWSLFDKKAGKELLFNNPVLRPAYLATRNAWCSGGVEWNCGIVGHSPFTCAPLFTATLTGPDGESILRMYEYERIRGVVYQMDFSLPEGSPVLYARMRVVNPSFRDTAMYWWSNIAVPEVPGARVVVSSDSAYTTAPDGTVIRVPIPLRDGRDVTYPERNPVSVDYFFRPKTHRRYTCQLSPEGYGLFEASTARLKGRKIFVWGQGPGGKKWQEYLSGEGNPGRYCEIQCGLANSQYECLPMPPATAWEWLEVYGPLQADPAAVHGPWDEAQAEVERRMDALCTPEALESRLERTRPWALKPAETLLLAGSGWGALENRRRAAENLAPMCGHLDFGAPGQVQQPWISLLETGSMGDHPADTAPGSWMRQAEWTDLLEQAAAGPDRENWYTLLELGCTYLARPDLLRAERYLTRSLQAAQTPWGEAAMAELIRMQGDGAGAAARMARAANLAPDDGNLAKRAARMLKDAGEDSALLTFTESRPAAVAELPRLRLYRAFALARLDRIEEAEALLCRDGVWLEVPDIKEGEISLSDLWYHIQEVRAARTGKAFDRSRVAPPHALDFRMFAAE